MAVFMLNNFNNDFPRPELADEDGLLAVGGDLTIERLLNAYSNGIFPWYNPGEWIHWWCPRERFVIFPNKIHVSKSMRKTLKTTKLTVEFNSDFASVIHNCQKMREGETWITSEMEIAYNQLFDAGHALSVGVYDNNTLVGGLYGVVIGKCFFGESMFSKAPGASKIALISLSQHLSRQGFIFIDCQFHTQHLESMGGCFLPLSTYMLLLKVGTMVR